MTGPTPASPPTPNPEDARALLVDLIGAPAGERLGRIAARGDPCAALLMLAEHLEQLMLADLATALAGSGALVQVADEHGDAVSRLRVRRARAQCLSYSNDFAGALSILEEAARLASEVGEQRELALVHMTMLHALARLGRLEEAVEAGMKAHDSLAALGDAVTAAKADVNLGVVQRMRDRPAEAIAHFDRARPSFAAQPHILAQIESNRAEAMLDLHDFERAESAFKAALETFERVGAHRAAAIVEGNLADLMGRQGRFAAALHHFERARRRLERDTSPGDDARLRAEAAEVQLQLGLLSEAAEASASAANDLTQQGMLLEAARARMTLARSLALLGHAGEAERVLLRAAGEFEQAGQPHQARRAAMAMAELFLVGGAGTERKDGDRIEQARLQLLRLLPELRERPADEAWARALLAEVELAAGSGPRAHAALEQVAAGLKIAEPLGVAPLTGRLYHLQGRALAALSRFDEALSALNAGVEQIEKIRASLRSDRFRISFHAGASSIYGDAIAAALKTEAPDRTAVAFGLAERARSRSLLDSLQRHPEAARPGRATGDDAAMLELEQEMVRWRTRQNALYTNYYESGGRVRGHESSGGWLAEITEVERQLARLESRLASSAGAGGLYAEPATLEEVKSSLPADSVLLEYFIAGDRVLCFVVQRDQPIVVTDLCALGQVAGIAERLRFQINRAIARGSDAPRLRSAADIDRELEDLYTTLLDGALPDGALPGRLIIAPHGPLHALPFHAFRAGDRYLIEATEVRYTPSASVLQHLGSDAPAPAGTGTGRALPVLVGLADQRAPGIDEELRSLGELLAPCNLLTGAEATIDALIGLAREAPILHIAAHGIFAGELPGTAGVRMADGWLTPRDVRGLRLRGPDGRGGVVALSGCDTGRSAATTGDELLGLVRAFLSAGAASVIASLWPVHDRTATELLVSTYKTWYLEGDRGRSRSLAACMRSAQLDFIARGIHPAFWAPFFSVGTL